MFALGFTSVQVTENTEALQVTYDEVQAGNATVVVQLTVSLAGESLAPGSSLSLGGTTPDGAPRTAVTHLAAGQSAIVLPAVQSGLLTLTTGGQAVGATTTGAFNLAFADDGSVAAGRTLSGTFSGPLQSASFPPDGSFDLGDGG